MREDMWYPTMPQPHRPAVCFFQTLIPFTPLRPITNMSTARYSKTTLSCRRKLQLLKNESAFKFWKLMTLQQNHMNTFSSVREWKWNNWKCRKILIPALSLKLPYGGGGMSKQMHPSFVLLLWLDHSHPPTLASAHLFTYRPIHRCQPT